MIPLEWLNDVLQTRDGYRRLLDSEGNLPAAAHRLAVAKCLTCERHTTVPTRSEVRAAARMIASRVPGTDVPDSSRLAVECEALGLSVM